MIKDNELTQAPEHVKAVVKALDAFLDGHDMVGSTVEVVEAAESGEVTLGFLYAAGEDEDDVFVTVSPA